MAVSKIPEATTIITALAFVDGVELMGVFSSLEKARQWTSSFPNSTGAVFSPYVLDVPEYGYIQQQDIH